MKKKNGFTLIELLTVIAILAIILLIAAPTILGVLEKSKKNTFKNQVLLYVEGLKQQVALASLNQADMSITLPDEGGSTTVNINDIPMDTKNGFSGSIKIVNEGGGKYKYYLVGVQNSDYKVNKEVESRSLNINDIVKADGSSKPEPVTYKSYKIGDQVTLKDNTVWYVIENSDSSSSTVTLFASQNIKHDAPGTYGGNITGWTTVEDEYIMLFDESNARSTENNSYCTEPEKGCNIYAAQSDIVTNGEFSGTVTEDSTIKKFVDSSVKSYINNSLTTSGGTNINGIRLITVDEICNIINASDSNNNCNPITTGKLSDNYTNVPEWLYSTNYWTMTPAGSNSYYVYSVYSNNDLYIGTASYGASRGARPVIVTLKSNIK